jgi:spore coat protein CotH
MRYIDTVKRLIFPFVCIPAFLFILAGCADYLSPSMDPVPFEPVRYQGSLTDEASALFGSDGVYRIEVDIAYDMFDTDNSNGVEYTWLASDFTSPATFTFYHDEYGETEPVVFHGIGMRMRGGWSFDNAPKKKYKIIFPENNEFYGLKRLNLNSNYGDNSFMREKLVYDLFNTAGIPSGRTAYTRLYFYDETEPDNYKYMGLYLLVEQVKSTFFKARFDSPAGNCYKNNGSELTRAPLNDWEYLSTPDNPQPTLEIMNNKDDFDPSDIVKFLDVLNNTPWEFFEQEIQEYCTVYEILSALAINSLTGLIDDYWYYAHNFFLYNYHGRFMWIPWDLDSSMGVDWGIIDMPNADIYAFLPRDSEWTTGRRPLIDRLMQVPSFVDYYRKCHNYYIEHYFNEENLYPRIDELTGLILDAALEDTYQKDGDPVTEADILDVIENVTKPYIQNRKEYVLTETGNAY